jgi:small-conductance mechanosensitive channel
LSLVLYWFMMASRTDLDGYLPLAGILVAYRLPIYVGGLLVISIPLVLSSVFSVVVPETARTVLVGVTLAVMIATYIAEHYVGYDRESEPRTEDEPTYSLRLRIALALSIVGIAVGIYVALEIALFTGLLFITGAYLFGYVGYRGEFGENENDRDAGEV